MDRKAYKLPFTKDGLLRWVCPTCNKGRLKLKKGTFNFEETKHSKRGRNHEAWDPDWIDYVYSCLLECTNPPCKDTIANSGTGIVDYEVVYDDEGNQHQGWGEYFRPKYFSPHLKIFICPKNTPDDVVDEIDKSFSLFFSDSPSAANHIRIGLEDLLTQLKVKRYELKAGKKTFLALHRRIELLSPKYKHLQDLFFAVKWLGNAGSHSEKVVTMDDVLDAYEIMDEILQDLFVKKTKRVKSLAKKIIKSKGPKKKAKKAW